MRKLNYRLYLSFISDQALKLFPLILILFFVFLTNRIIFFYLFSETSHMRWVEIVKGFILGVRFDSATIIYGLSIPILMLYLGLIIPSKIYLLIFRYFSKIWMTIILCIIFFIFGIDIYFYDFYQDHLNIIFFDMFEDDTKAVIKSIWKNYPVFWILFGLFSISIVFYYLLDKIFTQHLNGTRGLLQSTGILLGAFLIFAIMARASFGLFPINMMDAAYTNDAFLNKLGPNPVFTFEKAVEARISQKNALPFWRQHLYRENIQTAFSKSAQSFLGINNSKNIASWKEFQRTTKGDTRLETNPPHVVLIMMEGFGSWILDFESDEFQISCGVSDWIDQSIYFDHFIQSGFGSIQNLTATILSLPSLPNTIPLSQQKYSAVSFPSSLAENYKKNNYVTNFVYGGKLSWQRIGDFIPLQGFDHVFGEGDFDANIPKTDWGVFDEHLFNFVFEILSSSEKPQFIMFFTTTNHPPFELPDTFVGPPLQMGFSLKNMIRGNEELAQKRFGAYQYANCFLNQFLDDIYNTESLNNTITAVTADHNLQGIRNYNESALLHKYRVPFFLLGHEEILGSPKVITNFGSHVDIATTLTELTLPNIDYLSFGKNLFTNCSDCFTVNQNGIIFSNNSVLNYNYSEKFIEGSYEWNSKDRLLLSRVDNQDLELTLLKDMTAYYSSASFYIDEHWQKWQELNINKKESK